MIDHTSIGVRNFEGAIAFYSAALEPLGYSLQRVKDGEAAYGAGSQWGFFLYATEAGASLVGEKTHVAFSAASKVAVESFHAAAATQGAHSVRPPGPRPDISPEYFGTVLRDLDGHTIEAVYWERN